MRTPELDALYQRAKAGDKAVRTALVEAAQDDGFDRATNYRTAYSSLVLAASQVNDEREYADLVKSWMPTEAAK